METVESRGGGGVGELALAVVQEQPGRARRVEGRGEDVEVEVAVEVVDDRAAREVEAVDPEFGRDVDEAGEVGGGTEGGERQPMLRLDGGRMVAQRHVGQVQEPLRLDLLDGVRGHGGEVLAQEAGRLLGALALPVDRFAADGEDAGLGVVHPGAVAALAESQPGDGDPEQDLGRLASEFGGRPGRLAQEVVRPRRSVRGRRTRRRAGVPARPSRRGGGSAWRQGRRLPRRGLRGRRGLALRPARGCCRGFSWRMVSRGGEHALVARVDGGGAGGGLLGGGGWRKEEGGQEAPPVQGPTEWCRPDGRPVFLAAFGGSRRGRRRTQCEAASLVGAWCGAAFPGRIRCEAASLGGHAY